MHHMEIVVETWAWMAFPCGNHLAAITNTAGEDVAMLHRTILIGCGLAAFGGAIAVVTAQAQPQPAPAAAPVKLGIVSFLTGPAASPFGIPGRNGAEIVIEALNSGKAPAPYQHGRLRRRQDRSEIYRRGRLRRQRRHRIPQPRAARPGRRRGRLCLVGQVAWR